MPISFKTWAGTATLGLIGAFSTVAAPYEAKAAECPTTPTSISAIADCTVSQTQLGFFNFQELIEISGGTYFFAASGNTTTLKFDVNYGGDIAFNYKVFSNTLDIESIVQKVDGTYKTEDLLLSDPLPSVGPVSLASSIEAGTTNLTTVTGITHTFKQTPGPLPILGAGAAFGFSRKLRRRISQVG